MKIILKKWEWGAHNLYKHWKTHPKPQTQMVVPPVNIFCIELRSNAGEEGIGPVGSIIPKCQQTFVRFGYFATKKKTSK